MGRVKLDCEQLDVHLKQAFYFNGDLDAFRTSCTQKTRNVFEVESAFYCKSSELNGRKTCIPVSSYREAENSLGLA